MDPGRRSVLAALLAAPFAKASMAQPAPISRNIPSTGEALPVIGAGTWQTFDVGADPAARRALAEVLGIFAAAGARVIDSSPMYGSSEAVAGDLVAELGLRERLFVATKVWTSGRAEGLRQMEESFRRLRVKQMDLMQIHNLVDAATHTRTLQEMKKEGRIRYLGITHYNRSAHAEVEKWLATGRYDFVQINYSLGERDAEKRLLPLAAEKGAAVIVNRPFAEGSLFAKARGKALPAWAAELGIRSWAQYFLKWIAGHPAVTCAIPATSKPDHMRDNLAAGTGRLPDEGTRRRMLQYFDSL